MAERHFISQTSLTPLPPADVDGRVIMTDFNIFHNRPDNRAHFAETNSSDSEDTNENEIYQAGFEAGKAEATAVFEDTIKVMEDTLEQLKTTFAAKVREIEESHARVILQSLEAVLPALSKRCLLSEMQAVILQTAVGEIKGPLTAYLHPNNSLAKSFLTQKNFDELVIQEQNDLPETAVHFSWDASRAEIDPQGISERCLDILSEALTSFPETQLVELNSQTPLKEELIE